jgi:hypothetical protein
MSSLPESFASAASPQSILGPALKKNWSNLRASLRSTPPSRSASPRRKRTPAFEVRRIHGSLPWMPSLAPKR